MHFAGFSTCGNRPYRWSSNPFSPKDSTPAITAYLAPWLMRNQGAAGSSEASGSSQSRGPRGDGEAFRQGQAVLTIAGGETVMRV
jgi:hypothetical protein